MGGPDERFKDNPHALLSEVHSVRFFFVDDREPFDLDIYTYPEFTTADGIAKIEITISRFNQLLGVAHTKCKVTSEPTLVDDAADALAEMANISIPLVTDPENETPLQP